MGKKLSYAGMPTADDFRSIHEIRRENLRTILREKFDNSQRRLCEAYGAPPSFISRVLSGKNIGDTLARAFETVADRPRYWLDNDHSGSEQNKQTPSTQAEPDDDAGLPNSDAFPYLLTWSELRSFRKMREPAQIARAGKRITFDFSPSAHSFVLEVIDASMEPTFQRGEHIMVDANVLPQSGDFVIAFAGEEQAAMLRQYFLDSNGDQLLQALNPHWPDRVIRFLPDQDWVVGKVLCKFQVFAGTTVIA